MGMQQKLEREYQRGFQDGQAATNETLLKMASNSGFIKGAQDTWDIMERMFENIEGIGPKTKEKILHAIQQYAKAEKEKIVKSL